MDKSTLLESLQKLVEQENALEVSHDVTELRNRFEDLILEEERQFQIKQLDAQEKGEPFDEVMPSDSIKEAFYTLYAAYRERRNAQQKAKKEAEEYNLRKKKALIQRLQEVVNSEENIGVAMTAYKEIHEEWKTIGDVPREKRMDIQSEYSRLLETFFYHIKIYRELRDHDFHRNHQLKLDVIQRIQALKDVELIKDLEAAIKALQHEWDEIGPVTNEAWEELKNVYWDQVRAVYQRIHAFYEEKRSELTQNLEQKKEIVSKTQQFLTDLKAETIKDWEQATSHLLSLQASWKGIGYGPRKENDEVWKEFRKTCDEFFTLKKGFFEHIRGKFEEVATKKQALIARLNELKTSTDWKKTTDQILNIQKEWKKLGSAGQRYEQKLWKEFRAACDEFFNAKQAYYDSKDKELEGNLDEKLALIEQLKAVQLPENKQEALSVLKKFATQFNEIGHVPMKEKDTVYKAYKAALDGHYQKLKLEGEEQEMILFQAKVDTLKANPNASQAILKEKHDLHEKINKLKADILQFENNLGFFAKSKGADALRADVDRKINQAKARIEEYKAKLKLLNQ